MVILNALEIVGTTAFAVSGALVGISKGLDYYGVIVLAVTTALGGGIFRDILIGINPPTAFIQPFYTIVSICSAVFALVFHEKLLRYHKVMQFFDAVGLGAFTAIGASVAEANNLSSPYIVITLGLLTGTGGGIIRDVFAQKIPFVFRKEIYAVASITGSCVYLILRSQWDPQGALYFCFAATLILRLISIKYNIHLGRVRRNNS